MRIWLQNFVSIQPRTSLEKINKTKDPRGPPGDLAKRRSADFTDFYRFYRFCRFLEGSFSAVSTATIATKYSFFQAFRDLQNYLAKFSKFCIILQKSAIVAKISNFFCNKNPEISQKLCKIWRFFAKFCNFFKKSARQFCRVCKLLQNAYLVAKVRFDRAENELRKE